MGITERVALGVSWDDQERAALYVSWYYQGRAALYVSFQGFGLLNLCEMEDQVLGEPCVSLGPVHPFR